MFTLTQKAFPDALVRNGPLAENRRGLGSDPLEDTLRVVQNGCDASKFDGMTVAPLWREVFGHQWVK